MDKKCFSGLIANIYYYFNKTSLPEQLQVDLWYDDLKHIPEHARDHIFNHLKKFDRIPMNIAKEILGAYVSYRRAKPTTDKFRREDDPDYPVEYLWKGFVVLRSKGDDEFIQYAKKVNMPVSDIERVRQKSNVYDGN